MTRSDEWAERADTELVIIFSLVRESCKDDDDDEGRKSHTLEFRESTRRGRHSGVHYHTLVNSIESVERKKCPP